MLCVHCFRTLSLHAWFQKPKRVFCKHVNGYCLAAGCGSGGKPREPPQSSSAPRAWRKNSRRQFVGNVYSRAAPWTMPIARPEIIFDSSLPLSTTCWHRQQQAAAAAAATCLKKHQHSLCTKERSFLVNTTLSLPSTVPELVPVGSRESSRYSSTTAHSYRCRHARTCRAFCVGLRWHRPHRARFQRAPRLVAFRSPLRTRSPMWSCQRAASSRRCCCCSRCCCCCCCWHPGIHAERTSSPRLALEAPCARGRERDCLCYSVSTSFEEKKEARSSSNDLALFAALEPSDGTRSDPCRGSG